MSPPERTAWRCFPWDPAAPDGAPFSSRYLTPGQTVGRFDLEDRPAVRYLAEVPEHAIGEVLGPFRGTRFRPAYLRQGGHPLALVEARLAPSLVARVPDCTDPAVLAELGLRPDALAHHDRTLTQAIARRLHQLGAATGSPAGLRWWSALTGAWHTVVLFTDRERAGEVGFGTPRRLEPDDPEVVRALTVLGIRTR
ncbi:MAG: RES family NAD+ phosphorylase [Gemmatimonadales bacterium]|nr:RES family NAD+ phosphorylase [Gemmatimonadales bacterium]